MRSWFMVAMVLAGGWLISCTPKQRYERILHKELKSGVRHDSLFQGIYLGMTSKDFYTHCWKLNREGLIRQGEENTSVQYKMRGELSHPATMEYYPVFYEDKIVEMPVKFSYNGWAPWNKELSADKLELDVLRWYKSLYGGGFIKVVHPKWGPAYVKVDGNRRITIFIQQDMFVWAIFTDMSVDREKALPEPPQEKQTQKDQQQ